MLGSAVVADGFTGIFLEVYDGGGEIASADCEKLQRSTVVSTESFTSVS